MTVFDMQETLRRTGSYSTPAGCRRAPLHPAIASPLFHLRLFTIFLGGYLLALRPGFETREWSKFCFRFHRLTEWLGCVITVSGFQQVREARFPVVWVSNHMSSLETYLLPEVLTIYSSLMVVLKESLAHYPLFGRVVRSLRPIRVNRRSAVEDLRKVLTEGLAGIQAGRSVLVFPEGQRTRHFDPAGFNTMGLKLAQRAGVPVVPIAVRTDCLNLGPWIKDLGAVDPRRPIHIACGPVLPPDQPPRELHAACTGFIADKLREWERETGTTLLAAPVETVGGSPA